MNALEVLFLINKLEGELTRTLIDFRKKFASVHGVINMHKHIDPSFDVKSVKVLHRRVKEVRREISSLLQVARMDKKYG